MKKFILFIAAGLVLAALCAAQPSRNDPWLQEGIASYYGGDGSEFEGRPTASGEIFNGTQFTAAHPTLPFGTILKITNKHNNKTVLVRVNDRGPFVAARIIDLSHAAARQLDMIKTGTAPVLVESLPAMTSFGGSMGTSSAGIRTEALPASGGTADGLIADAFPQNGGDSAQAQTAQPEISSAPASGYPPRASWTPPGTGVAALPQAQPSAPYWQSAAQLKGNLPGGADGAKTYRVQVGSYSQPKNAVDTFEKLRSAGLNPAYEKYNDYYRVVLAGVKSGDLQSIAEKLGQAGFREAIVKEE